MIHNRKLYLILALLLIINISMEPIQKAETAALSLGSIYGTSLGTKLLAFILASTSVGVTFKALEEAEKMFDKWQLDSDNWEPPGDNPNNNWAELLQAMLGASLLQDRIPTFLNSIKEFFQSLSLQVGENKITLDNVPYFEDIEVGQTITSSINIIPITNDKNEVNNNLYTFSYKGHSFVVKYRLSKNKFNTGYTNITTNLVGNGKNQQLLSTKYKNSDLPYILEFNHSATYDDSIDYYKFAGKYVVEGKDVIEDYIPPQEDLIELELQSNSTVITNIPPPYTPQPPINNIPYETNITSVGQEETIYIGDLNDLSNDVVNNTTWQDLINTSINYQIGTSEPVYTLTPTEEGVIIITEPETEKIPTPYPNPEFEPIEDVSEYQGKSIGLLQSIINWLKLIYDSIQKFFEMPEDLTLDTTSLRLADFQYKFPFSIPWDLYNSINVFAETPSEPELIIDIDTEYLKVNHEIDITSIYIPLTFVRYVATIFFIIYLANKTRDLIKW